LTGSGTVYTPASIVDDTPQTFWIGRTAWNPSNFKHELYGSMTLRDALARSDNIATVKVAEGVGLRKVVDLARAAGLNDAIQATPSVALGTYQVTPFEIAEAYTAFANGGLRLKPVAVGGAGNEPSQALDPRVAYLMAKMLEEVTRSGTGAGIRARGFTLPAAGKTGTDHDGWFAGFTSRLLCVVWVGFDDYRELHLEGAKSALPIWAGFMKRAAQYAPWRNAEEFPSPGGIATAHICRESGKIATDSCTYVRDEVFIAGTQPSSECDMHGAPQQQASADDAGDGAPAPPPEPPPLG
jgi:penicillin-binding protein 1B